jgi:dihydroorotase
MINELIIPRPDDMHLHLREGKMLKVVSQHSASQFGRAIIMPNLKNPSYKY